MDERLAGRLSLLRRPLGPDFERRTIDLAPGLEQSVDGSEWRDALVVIECGEIELVSSAGVCLALSRGAVLFLNDLHLRALRNRGSSPALLCAISRRRR